MQKTRKSLWFLTSFLLASGASFLLLPQLTATLFLSNTVYPDLMLRVIGMFLFAFGIVMLQIVRHRIEVLYLTTVIVRAFIAASLLWFFAITLNPMYLVLVTFVIVGTVITGYNYMTERKIGAARI